MEISIIILSVLCLIFFFMYRSKHYKCIRLQTEKEMTFNLSEIRKQRLTDQYNELQYYKNEATNKQIEINKYLGLLGVDPDKVDCN